MTHRCGLRWAVALMIVVTTIGARIGSAPLPVQAAELDEIIERGYLVVAIKDDWRPLGFRDETGELTGLEVEIAHRLAEDLLGDANAVQFQPVSNQARLSLLLDGEVDLVIAGVTATDSRSRLVSFSTPYYLDGTAFVTRSAAIQDISDLAHEPVALLNGSSAISSVRATLPAVEMIGVDSYQEALDLLEAGGAIAFAGDASVLAGWVQEYPEYRILPSVVSVDALAIAMPRGNQYDPLRREVNAAVAQWYREGWLEDRVTYWGLPQ